MYLLKVRKFDGVSNHYRCPVEVFKGDIVIVPMSTNSTALGVVAARKRIPWPSKEFMQMGTIESVVTPITANELIATQFGTVCKYNMRVPGEIGASYWRKDSDVVEMARNVEEAEEFLRTQFNEEFFRKADREIGDDEAQL